MLYALYDQGQKKFIAEMEKTFLQEGEILSLGAVQPEYDGNYFKQIIVAGNLGAVHSKMGLRQWWQWALSCDKIIIADEFSFVPEEVVIVELVLGNICSL